MGLFKERLPILGLSSWRWVDRDWWQSTKMWVDRNSKPLACRLLGHKFPLGEDIVCQRNRCRFLRTWNTTVKNSYSQEKVEARTIRRCGGCKLKFYWPFQYAIKAVPVCPFCNKKKGQ